MQYIKSFFWGILAALGALTIQMVVFLGFSFVDLSSTSTFSQIFAFPLFIFSAALIEETFKYLVIFKRLENLPAKKTFYINSLLIGFGFFIAEILLITETGQFPVGQILAEIGIIHLGTAGLIGYFVATKNPKKISTWLLAVGIATIFHAIYNFLNLNRNQNLDYPILVVLGALVFFNIATFLRFNHSLAQD